MMLLVTALWMGGGKIPIYRCLIIFIMSRVSFFSSSVVTSSCVCVIRVGLFGYIWYGGYA